MLPPGKRRETDSLRRASRDEAFVTGQFFGHTSFAFAFTAYQQGQWLSRFIDPDRILKPRLVGTMTNSGETTTISYRIDAVLPSRGFFALTMSTILLSLLAVVLGLTDGWSVPGATYFSALVAATFLVFEIEIWRRVPGAAQEEVLLGDWFSRALQV